MLNMTSITKMKNLIKILIMATPSLKVAKLLKQMITKIIIIKINTNKSNPINIKNMIIKIFKVETMEPTNNKMRFLIKSIRNIEKNTIKTNKIFSLLLNNLTKTFKIPSQSLKTIYNSLNMFKKRHIKLKMFILKTPVRTANTVTYRKEIMIYLVIITKIPCLVKTPNWSKIDQI